MGNVYTTGVELGVEEAILLKNHMLAVLTQDLDRLRAVFRHEVMEWQVSRTAFLSLLREAYAECESMADSKEREEATERVREEEMAVFAAESRGLVLLGDTLLHVACRVGQEDVIRWLVRWADKSTALVYHELENAKGQTPQEACANEAALSILMEDHKRKARLTKDELFREEGEVLVRTARRLWGFWMYSDSEAKLLVRVIVGARTRDKYFSTFLKLMQLEAQKSREFCLNYARELATMLLDNCDGDLALAERTFGALTTAEKLKVVAEMMAYNLPDPTLVSAEMEINYLTFLDTALAIALEWEHVASVRGVLPKSEQTALQVRLWKQRIVPPDDRMEYISSSMIALEDYCGLLDG
eukprot:PLAT12398.1.p1 GENE.PLAT12398.1~~PLAT12398.1.p1  ORF type:complete len:357 (-),score=120.85 PLAT12398.1:1384-2454(-)